LDRAKIEKMKPIEQKASEYLRIQKIIHGPFPTGIIKYLIGFTVLNSSK